MLVFRYRQQQRFYETLMSTIDLSAPGLRAHYDELLAGYKNVLFPYVQRSIDVERNQTRNALDKAFLAGPVYIRDGRLVDG